MYYMRFIRRILKDNKGSAIIFELAFLLPVMIMVFYGYTMFTNALAIDLAVKTASREGAREYAITGNANAGITKAIQELESSKVYNANITSFTDGDGVGVTVVKKYEFTIPFVGVYGPNLKGVGVFVKEPS